MVLLVLDLICWIGALCRFGFGYLLLVFGFVGFDSGVLVLRLGELRLWVSLMCLL